MSELLKSGVFSIRGAAGEASLYQVDNRELATRAGALLKPRQIDIVTPTLGQWPLFLVSADFALGQWLITNDYLLAVRTGAQWTDACVERLVPGVFVQLAYDGLGWQLTYTPRQATLMPADTIDSLDEAIAVVDESLNAAVQAIVAGGKPVMLLLSGGVDSGLLCALLASHGADVQALSIRTPWGDELEGARRTAESAGVPMLILELTEQDIIDGIEHAMHWLQHAEPETVLIQVLVTIAQRYAAAHSRDLITGMGSDLLNAVTETGMTSSDASIYGRIHSTSASGLFQTNALGTLGEHLVHHPYWQAATIAAQLSVCDRLKSGEGYEKYYLRQLAARRLPEKTAFGTKTAIHQGTNLYEGLNQALAPKCVEQYIADAWSTIVSTCE
jgi:hypothetical protein